MKDAKDDRDEKDAKVERKRERPYSHRSAIIGSTLVARWAGM